MRDSSDRSRKRTFWFLKEQGNNTLGTFMRKMVRGSLTEEQQNCWMKACRRKYIEWGRQDRRFGVVLFLPDTPIICSIGSRQLPLLLATEPLARYQASGSSGTSVREISSLNSFITKGWSAIMSCCCFGSGGVSFVGPAHGTLGVDSYGVGGGLGGRKAIRIELSAFRHNHFNRIEVFCCCVVAVCDVRGSQAYR